MNVRIPYIIDMKKIVKCTSKGQITLPMKWRSKFETDNFAIEYQNDQLIVKPVIIEEVIFNADRDNDGKGLDPQEIIDMIREIDNDR